MLYIYMVICVCFPDIFINYLNDPLPDLYRQLGNESDQCNTTLNGLEERVFEFRWYVNDNNIKVVRNDHDASELCDGSLGVEPAESDRNYAAAQRHANIVDRMDDGIRGRIEGAQENIDRASKIIDRIRRTNPSDFTLRNRGVGCVNEIAALKAKKARLAGCIRHYGLFKEIPVGVRYKIAKTKVKYRWLKK